ncbi:hypothetical protein BV898_15254 [Hypsibius exemplaris]|uniref:Uncharacterized protein n=1 Tax=Hypsibius exemplaris TaxID=2072580 RepID=A0A9X6RK18_HYPEX|nr:hypothetical protein BV898_15254 [Hypsibius exemplaris]
MERKQPCTFTNNNDLSLRITMASKRYLTVFCLVILALQQTDALFGTPKHCTWHGTAPACWPSCPSGKVSKMETSCGPNKLLCCVIGKKKLCCPKDLDITPEMAAAIARS